MNFSNVIFFPCVLILLNNGFLVNSNTESDGPSIFHRFSKIHLERSKYIFNWLSKKIEKYGVEVKLTHFNENQNEIFYGYNYRPANYSSINGSICSNNQSYNGVIFGKFKCPIEGFDLDETECCDANDKQFCCKPITSFFNLTLFILLLALLFAFFIALVIIIICIFRKPQHQLVPYFD